mmetsp:Transcript_45796/g.97874  ORF Transcript_45796/g.97874 Transcript_45796/m.97874 type:complete len:364 (+) Transcript_45796:146-1237(+)
MQAHSTSHASHTKSANVVWGVDVDLTASKGIVDEMHRSATHGPAIVTQTSDGEDLIVATNSSWRHLCGFGAEEALGCSPKILQGTKTDLMAATQFRNELLAKGTASITLINYTKSGREFVHELHSRTIVDDATGYTYNITESLEQRADGLLDIASPKFESVDTEQAKQGANYGINALVAGCAVLAIGYGLAVAFVVMALANTVTSGTIGRGCTNIHPCLNNFQHLPQGLSFRHALAQSLTVQTENPLGEAECHIADAADIRSSGSDVPAFTFSGVHQTIGNALQHLVHGHASVHNHKLATPRMRHPRRQGAPCQNDDALADGTTTPDSTVRSRRDMWTYLGRAWCNAASTPGLSAMYGIEVMF